LPDATLQSLGLFTFADAGTAAVQLETGGALLRLITADLGPTAVAQVASDVDLDRLAEYIDSVESLDLTKVRPSIALRTLFLEPIGELAPYPEGESCSVFKTLVPSAAVRQVPHWPRSRYEDPDGGRALAQVVVDFIGRSVDNAVGS
jgi:hypothetical protein